MNENKTNINWLILIQSTLMKNSHKIKVKQALSNYIFLIKNVKNRKKYQKTPQKWLSI